MGTTPKVPSALLSNLLNLSNLFYSFLVLQANWMQVGLELVQIQILVCFNFTLFHWNVEFSLLECLL